METIEDLYDRYKNDVYRLALSYMANVSDAEDVTQTAFLKLIHHRKSVAPGKERSWLLTVAANECRSCLRRQKRMTQDPVPERAFEEPEESRLCEALKTLKPTYRAVVHLHYFEGYSTKEIGDMLNLRQSCVTTRLNRARTMLKAALGRDYL